MKQLSRRTSRTHLSRIVIALLAVGAAACGDDAAIPANTTGTDIDGGAADGGTPETPDAAPVATAQSVTTTKDEPLSIALVATDAEGKAVTYAVATEPAHGTLSGLDAATGLVTYTPAADFLGEDSFTFTGSDGTLTSEPATVKVTVVAADLAVAQAQAVSTNEDTATDITLTSTGGVTPVTFAIATPPAHGTLGTLASGKVTYTPAANYNGADTFSFTAKGVGADATTANVNITVTAVDDPAVAVAKNLVGYAGAPMQIKLTATDVDDAGPFTFAAGNAVNGTLGALAADTITFTPTAVGTATFTFTANDGHGAGPAATVTIDVKAAATSCAELLGAGVVTSGLYAIDPDGAGATPTLSMQCDQTNDGGGWTRVFFHDSTAGYFADKTAAALSNANAPTDKRYSVLSYLEAFRANGGFEFKIDWPLVPSKYNIWQQTSNPVTAAAAGTRVTGYRGVRIDANSERWGGLELSTNSATLLDGSVRHPNWWYAIGSVTQFNGAIPAAQEIGGNGATSQVELWVRPIPTCGNGKKESLETCDDGNPNGGDGCSASCAVERTNRKTCREILAANESAGDGTYVIDADGAGAGAAFPVYCDMTNDSGGWTLVGKTGQGDFTDLTDAQYLSLVAEPLVDVNVGGLTEGSVAASATMAFFGKAHTNALYAAGGKVVRVEVSNNQQDGNAVGTYFQEKVSPPANWDFWSALRDSRRWNNDGSVSGDYVNGLATQFYVAKGSPAYDAATDTVTDGSDGSFGWWSSYDHVLSDNTTLSVSRHGGLLCDGVGNVGWLWLLTFDKNDGRWKNDPAWTRIRIWLR